MTSELEASIEEDDSPDDMHAFLARLERENPTVAAAALDHEVNQLLGRPSPPKPGMATNETAPKRRRKRCNEESVFSWFSHLSRQIPPVMDKKQHVEAAKAVEVGMFAQEYLDTIDHALISRMDRRDLRRLIEHGQAEYEMLILSNLRLVLHWSRGIALTLGVDWVQDAFQAGVFGLIRGIQGWDYTKGYALSTYVSWHIRQQIQRWRADETQIIRVPVHMWERLGSITEDTTDPSELAALRAQRIMPIEDVPEDLPGMIYDSGLDEVLDKVDGERFARLVFTSLNDREATVLKMRYGFPEVGGEPMTLDAIGETMKLTRERIRQIESKAIDKMRAMAGIVQGTQSSRSRSPREGRRSPSSAA